MSDDGWTPTHQCADCPATIAPANESEARAARAGVLFGDGLCAPCRARRNERHTPIVSHDRPPPPIEWCGGDLPRPILPTGGMMPTNDDHKVRVREELVEVLVRAYCQSCGGELQHSPTTGHPHGHKCRNLVDCGRWYTLSKTYPHTRRVA